MKEWLHVVEAEKEKVLGELYTTLTFLQGENSLEASRIRFASAYKSDNIIPVGESYSALMDAFQKFKTKKGVYVVCEDKIHLIHSAYIENVGRAFFLAHETVLFRRICCSFSSWGRGCFIIFRTSRWQASEYCRCFSLRYRFSIRRILRLMTADSFNTTCFYAKSLIFTLDRTDEATFVGEPDTAGILLGPCCVVLLI